MNDSIYALAARVRYSALRDYLIARGWKSMPSRISYAGIYRSPGGGDVEVQIPLDLDLADYADAITLAARGLSSFEGRPVEQILRDLL